MSPWPLILFSFDCRNDSFNPHLAPIEEEEFRIDCPWWLAGCVSRLPEMRVVS